MDDRFAERYKIKSNRLKGWDYSSPGKYFVTICALHMNKFFGKIFEGEMQLSKVGKIVLEEIDNTCLMRKNIKIHEYVVMPNHIHLLIEKFVSRGALCAPLHKRPTVWVDRDVNMERDARSAPLHNKMSTFGSQKDNLASLVRGLKSVVYRRAEESKIFFAWQMGYYDEVIKDQKRFFQIKNYIKNNIKNWQKDKLCM